jgi:hypothetical protein
VCLDDQTGAAGVGVQASMVWGRFSVIRSSRVTSLQKKTTQPLITLSTWIRLPSRQRSRLLVMASE